MQTATAPVLKYPGSKWNIADWIIQHMPEHTIYLEPFFGGGAVFFNKRPSQVETINDIDGNVINLFKIIRDHPDDLARLVYFTPWAREEFITIMTSAKDPDPFVKTGDELEDARRFLIRCWMAFSGVTSDRTGWACDVAGKQYSGISRRWCRVPEQILQAAERLKKAQIENQPAVKIITRYRSVDTLIYCDPPYVRSTRWNRMYKHEMTDQDHIELLEILDKHPGPVLISGYDSDLYNERLYHWQRRTTLGLAAGYKKRTEVLWLNQVAASQINGTLEFEF